MRPAIDILEVADVDKQIDNKLLSEFGYYFDIYLQSNYNLTEAEFSEILKDRFPEKFI